MLIPLHSPMEQHIQFVLAHLLSFKLYPFCVMFLTYMVLTFRGNISTNQSGICFSLGKLVALG